MSNIIKQLSIFVNNEPGRLAHITSVLKECKINMRAFNLAESTEFGILRTIVENPDEAYDALKAKGIIVKKTDVIGVYLVDTPGALFDAADALGYGERGCPIRILEHRHSGNRSDRLDFRLQLTV